jgi:hypothetical protein
MGFGPFFGNGFIRLIDANQRYMQAGGPTYLRLRNFPDIQELEFAQLGFSISPTGTSQVGTTDILIVPPPSNEPVSTHDIGKSRGKLRFGATKFLISQTFIEDQMAAQGLTDQSLVFRGRNVVGLVTDMVLWSIEDIIHKDLGGKTVMYFLTCNANEIR